MLVIETERLVLRELTEADFEILRPRAKSWATRG